MARRVYLCSRLCRLFGFKGMPFQLGAAFFCVDYQAVRKNMHKFEDNTFAVIPQ